MVVCQDSFLLATSLLLSISSVTAFQLFRGSTGIIKNAFTRGRNTRTNQRFVDLGISLEATTEYNEGQVLLPSRENDETQFDTACVASPVVIPPCSAYSVWQMYYYGNAGCWNHGIKSFLPTGWIGLAESKDGIKWEKVRGKGNTNGCVLAPSQVEEDWDSVQLGLGDVIRISKRELHMYYFGGSSEKVPIGPPAAGGIQGFRMRIGRAKSLDNGRTWERMGVALDYNEKEGFFASWPKIIIPENDPSLPWRMIYHSFNGTTWRVFSASSSNKGDTWTREGLILEGDTNVKNSFDFSGIGTRDVSPWQNGLLMVYEGVNQEGVHSLGAAFCTNSNGEGPWKKLKEDGWKQPGGPILQPGVGAMGNWTAQVIGTPCVISMPDGSLRLYHCAKQKDTKMSIGLVISESGKLNPSSWTPIQTSSIIDIVQNVAGMNLKEWERILSRVPEIKAYNPANCKDCLTQIQQRLSVSQLELKKKIVLRLPQVLGYNYETNVGPELDKLQQVLLLSDEELTCLVLKCPQIIGLEYDVVIRSQIEAIQKELDLDLPSTKALILQKPAYLNLPVRGGA